MAAFAGRFRPAPEARVPRQQDHVGRWAPGLARAGRGSRPDRFGRGGVVGAASWQEHAPPADGPVAPIGVWALGRIRGRERCRAAIVRPGDARHRGSPATAECATVFGRLEVLSGKSRLKILIVGAGKPGIYVT